MINAWSLLYDEIYGDDEMSPCKTDHIDDDFLVGLSTDSADTNVFSVDTSNFDNVSINTSESDDFITIAGGENTVYDFDDLDYDVSQFTVAEEPIATSVNFDHITFTDADADLFASMDGVELPTPGIEKDCNRKYKEDESIKALQNYISTTYGGHYTSKQNRLINCRKVFKE